MVLTLADLTLSAADRATLSDFLNSWGEHGRPVLFVGAGMSTYNAVPRPGAPATAQIKDWGGLVNRLRQQLAGGDSNIEKSLPTDYLRLAQLHETQFQRVRLLDAVDEALASEHFDPGPAHARLKRFEWEAIITTNYDDLLERTFDKSQNRPLTKVVWDEDLTRRRSALTLLLIKMHGDQQDRSSIVLTEDDYRCYEQTRPGVALKVKQLLLEHPSLFIGFSLSDPNVAAIEGWIRDTTGRLRLPSVVLVHHEPLASERDMWARRGVKLVYVPRCDVLQRVLDAIYGERQRRQNAAPVRRESVGDREIDSLLETRDEGWEKAAARLLVRLTDSIHESEFATTVRFALQGGLRNVSAESVQRVLDALGPSEKRRVFLRAQANGVLEAGGSGQKLLDIEEYLLNDSQLSPSERGDVLVNRATRAEQRGSLEAARNDLIAARTLDLDVSTRARLDKSLRRVLLRIGDTADINDELLDSPIPEAAAFEYARRGAHALLMRGTHAASRWYKEALSYARTGDEKTAALQGLQACADPHDWSTNYSLQEERLAILPEERPRTERVYELQSSAGRKVLAMYRAGPIKAAHQPNEALDKLREALQEADDMGWPRSARPNLTTISDGLALELVGLSLANEPTVSEFEQVLTFAIERGLLGVGRHFDSDVFDGIAAKPEAIRKAREILQSHEKAPFRSRTQSLLRSALLPLLSDDEIARHIETCVVPIEQESAGSFEQSSTQSHLELLVKHYRCVPPSGAKHLLRFFSNVFREGDRPALRASWLRAPLQDWTRTGVLKVTDPELRDCVSSLKSVVERGAVAKDPFVRRIVFHWLGELAKGKLLTDCEHEELENWLDAALIDASRRSPVDESDVFELAHMRVLFGPWSPSREVSTVFANGYAKLKNSTAVGRWLTLVKDFATVLTPDERKGVVQDVLDYAALTLNPQHSMFGPFPDWAAEAISQAATNGLLETTAALEQLQELARQFPEALTLAADIPGIDVEALERQLLASLVVEHEDVSLLRWCQELPAGRHSPRVERVALGGLHAREGRSRQVAYWCCAALAENGNLSEDGRGVLAEAVVEFGSHDRDWHVRAAALTAAARLPDAIESEALKRLLLLGEEDPIAHVRRASGLLALATRNDTGAHHGSV